MKYGFLLQERYSMNSVRKIVRLIPFHSYPTSMFFNSNIPLVTNVCSDMSHIRRMQWASLNHVMNKISK